MHSSTVSLLTTLSILSLAACAGKEQAAADTVAKTAQSGDPSPAVVTVTAKDFAFEAPAEIPAGLTTFRLTNDSKNFHHLILVRLDSGKTASDFTEAIKKPGPFPAWAPIVGGPNAPNPSQQSNATLDVQPGNYVMLCVVDVPGGIPHVAKGMIKALTVTASTATAKAPTPDVSIAMKEYGFDVSKPITAGSHTFEVKNTGAQDHEIEIIKLEPGKTVEDLGKWMAKPDGPPPGSAIGGVIAGKGTGPVYFTADFTPGSYVMMCLIPDAKDGKPHLAHGMVQNFTVN